MTLRFLAGFAVGLVLTCGAASAAAIIAAPESPDAALRRLAAESGTSHPQWPGVPMATTVDAVNRRLNHRLIVPLKAGPVAAWLSASFPDEQLADHCRDPLTQSAMDAGLTRTLAVSVNGETVAQRIATPESCAAVAGVRSLPGYRDMSDARQAEMLEIVADGLRQQSPDTPLVQAARVDVDADADRIHMHGRAAKALNARQLAQVRAAMPGSDAVCQLPSARKVAGHGINYAITVRDKRGQLIMDIDCPASDGAAG